MKPLAVLLTAAAGSVSATGISDATTMNCAKANANYCVSQDVILRCNGQALGAPIRCAHEFAAYPAAAGAAGCLQSHQEAGDAVCHQNCLVHADTPYLLPASRCTPKKTLTVPGNYAESGVMSIPEGTGTTNIESTQTATTNLGSTETGVLSIPEGTGTTNIEGSQTGIFSIPEGTSTGTPMRPVTSETGFMSIPEGTGTSLGTPQPPMTSSAGSTGSSGSSSSAPSYETDTASSTQSASLPSGVTTSGVAMPTAGAPAHRVAGMLAVAGLAAALVV
ncbi:Accumulation-associated protein [Ophiocordyceps camponoti-floridani]|uniref:Accumulation-associated protein n=1 Tax=Ophiocordyceps camponoti-floridani TaxID=2030778 RepID=A0A8H4Q0I6_9HYPO|nr:Accumulation-associated protein [Ophiocordyceps camponoti-floridani]